MIRVFVAVFGLFAVSISCKKMSSQPTEQTADPRANLSLDSKASTDTTIAAENPLPSQPSQLERIIIIKKTDGLHLDTTEDVGIGVAVTAAVGVVVGGVLLARAHVKSGSEDLKQSSPKKEGEPTPKAEKDSTPTTPSEPNPLGAAGTKIGTKTVNGKTVDEYKLSDGSTIEVQTVTGLEERDLPETIGVGRAYVLEGKTVTGEGSGTKTGEWPLAEWLLPGAKGWPTDGLSRVFVKDGKAYHYTYTRDPMVDYLVPIRVIGKGDLTAESHLFWRSYKTEGSGHKMKLTYDPFPPEAEIKHGFQSKGVDLTPPAKYERTAIIGKNATVKVTGKDGAVKSYEEVLTRAWNTDEKKMYYTVEYREL